VQELDESLQSAAVSEALILLVAIRRTRQQEQEAQKTKRKLWSDITLSEEAMDPMDRHQIKPL